MPNPVLRAKLAELVLAQDDRAAQAVAERYGADLLTDEADAELVVWLAEIQDQPERVAQIISCRIVLRRMRLVREERLYAAFKNVSDGRGMAALVQALSADELNTLARVAEQQIRTAQGQEFEAIRGRLEALQTLRYAQARLSPLERALADFLQAETDEAARAVLLARPELLLSDAAGRRLDSYVDRDPAGQAHLEHRRALWREVAMHAGGS
jgi:hypothetical protein